MNRCTLTIDNQTLTFAVEDIASIEAALIEAARKPGQQTFRALGPNRVGAKIELNVSGTTNSARHTTSGLPGDALTFSQTSAVPVILTDC
ncbi:hypothetical protein [Pseudomonas oryzihabitans]|uniref:hypothetical protein n=1 Tax=Pseudomonas oryzihabitans TaxID=47885 RepID=UPI00135ED3BC|nr:hypothetical protein [Pseudomonas oryzihabitans]MXS19275.1 hypothetical protein [Pseudomonas oryzihabitans]